MAREVAVVYPLQYACAELQKQPLLVWHCIDIKPLVSRKRRLTSSFFVVRTLLDPRMILEMAVSKRKAKRLSTERPVEAREAVNHMGSALCRYPHRRISMYYMVTGSLTPHLRIQAQRQRLVGRFTPHYARESLR
jgi:hypothetical protein